MKKLYRIMFIIVDGPSKRKGDFDIVRECPFEDKLTMSLIVDEALAKGFYPKIRIREEEEGE